MKFALPARPRLALPTLLKALPAPGRWWPWGARAQASSTQLVATTGPRAGAAAGGPGHADPTGHQGPHSGPQSGPQSGTHPGTHPGTPLPGADVPAQGVPLARVAVAKMAVDRETFERHKAALAACAAAMAASGEAHGPEPGAAGQPGALAGRPVPTLGEALPVRRRASDQLTVPAMAAERPRPPLDLRAPAFWGLAVVLAGSIGFVTWAATAPLAEGVPAEGYVKVETNRKPVQHLRGGIVDAILVREGDAVKAGQVLLRLNDADVKSRAAVVESRFLTALALQARLLAERQGAQQLVFPAELRSAADQAAAADAMHTQHELFAARRSGVSTDVAMQTSTAQSLENYIRGLQAQAQAKAEQIRLLQVELDSMRELAAQGFVPRARVSDLERQILLLQGQRGEDLGNIARVKGSVSESRYKIVQRRTDVSKDVESQLTEVQSRVNELREQRSALAEELERTQVRSPGDGVVVDLAVHSVGAVINPSQRILDVVPAREPLVVEAQVPARLFDNLHKGMVCEVRFTGPDQSITRPVMGQVNYIAADRSIDPARGESYFVTRVQISDQALAEAGLKVMQPGMPATVMITTAQRSLLRYLVAPLGKRLSTAMGER